MATGAMTLADISIRSGSVLQEKVADDFQTLRALLGLSRAIETTDTKITTNRYIMDDIMNTNYYEAGKGYGKVGELGRLKTFGAKVVQSDFEWDFTKIAFKMSHEAQIKIMAGQDVNMASLNEYVGKELIRMFIHEMTENIGRQVSLRKGHTLEGDDMGSIYCDYFRKQASGLPQKPADSMFSPSSAESAKAWKAYEEAWGPYLYDAFCEAIVRGDTEIQSRSKRSRSFTESGDVVANDIPSKNLAIMPIGMLDYALIKHLKGGLLQTYHDRLFRYIDNLHGYTCVFLPVNEIPIYRAGNVLDHTTDKWIMLLDSRAINTYYVDFGKAIPKPTSTLEGVGKPNLITSWIDYQSGTETLESDAFYRHFRWGITSYITDPSSVIFFDLAPNFQTVPAQ